MYACIEEETDKLDMPHALGNLYSDALESI